MVKHCAVTLCFLALSYLCLVIDINCALPSTDARLQRLENIVASVTKAFSSGKKAQKRFEKNILDLVKDHNKSPAHGIWTTWLPWGPCPVSCGVGLQKRDRTCTQSIPGPHGRPCDGDASDYRLCPIQKCPGSAIDDIWSGWSGWGPCSATCNGGMRARHRSCNNPATSQPGKSCNGHSVESQVCSNKNCPNAIVYFNVGIPNKMLTTSNRPIFTNMVANEGQGYNIGTAVFTCPVSGLYLFSLTFVQSSKLYTECWFYHNNIPVAKVTTFTNTHWNSASSSVFVRLNQWDTFDVRRCVGWHYVSTGYNTFFTGALVTPA